ncbi:MAG: hypothetical protein ACLPTZ_13935 [Beijerinckiaceae bacterium]
MSWEAQAKAQRIVISSSSVRLEPLSRRKVGACAIGRRVDACLSCGHEGIVSIVNFTLDRIDQQAMEEMHVPSTITHLERTDVVQC